MATESLRNFEAAIEAWDRRDVEATPENIREDVVWMTARSLPDIDLVYEGHAGLRRFFTDFSEPWEGIELDSRFIQIYRFDEAHRVREFHAFTEDDREQALLEAGIDD